MTWLRLALRSSPVGRFPRHMIQCLLTFRRPTDEDLLCCHCLTDLLLSPSTTTLCQCAIYLWSAVSIFYSSIHTSMPPSPQKLLTPPHPPTFLATFFLIHYLNRALISSLSTPSCSNHHSAPPPMNTHVLNPRYIAGSVLCLHELTHSPASGLPFVLIYTTSTLPYQSSQ